MAVVTDSGVLDTVGIPDHAAVWAAKQEQIEKKARNAGSRGYPHGKCAFGGNKVFRLPVYVDKIEEKACAGCRNLWIYAPGWKQVESFRPLLLASRAVLLTDDFMLPVMRNCGFEKAFCADEKGTAGQPAGGKANGSAQSAGEKMNGLVQSADGRTCDWARRCVLNLPAYDSNYARVRDKDERLLIALARLLYPAELSESARKNYESEIKKRFRPAMKLLVFGMFDRYGKPSPHAGEVLALGSMDRFLKKELVQDAAKAGNEHYAEFLLTGVMPEIPNAKENTEARKKLRMMFSQMLDHRRIPESKIEAKSGSHAEVDIHRSAIAASIAEEFLVEEYLGPDFSRPETERLGCRLVYDLILRDYGKVTVKTVNRWLLQAEQADGKIPEIEELLKFAGTRKKEQDNENAPGDENTSDDRNSSADSSHGRLSNLMQMLSDLFATGLTENTGKQHAQDDRKEKVLAFMEDGSGQKRGGGGKYSFAGQGSAEAKEEEAALTKREGYDYRDFLRQFMTLKEDRILDLDSFDPVYYAFGLDRYGDVPLIEPLETKEMMRLSDLVIVIDTSGSCSGKLVRFFLEETWSVFGEQENFFDHFHVRLLQCDHVVQEDKEICRLADVDDYMKNLKIRGGGATDFGAAFTYINRLKENGEIRHLKGILYFTDGFGRFPKYAPKEKCAFIFLKSRFADVEVPGWARKLLLPLPENADWEPEYTGAFKMNI